MVKTKGGTYDPRNFCLRSDADIDAIYFGEENIRPGDVHHSVEFKNALVVADYNERDDLIGLEVIPEK